MKSHYTYDSSRRIWFRTDTEPLNYSDGEAAENYILSLLNTAEDVSTSSLEVRNAIRDWPSEYHLSPVRHNLLRPFKFKVTDRILELGCGCGSITRYLGETGATIIAVEGNPKRAEIAAKRCRDLPNVTVYCDNLSSFHSNDSFDYVTLIGVLEYSPIYIKSKNPSQKCLEIATSFLSEGGSLILAIENQLGLKYFAGSEEDHTETPFFGVHNLYNDNGPVTFGNSALRGMLNTIGMKNVNFYYPFPDYKLPTILLSEQALFDPELRIADLLARATIGQRGGEYRTIHEGLAWKAVSDNHLVAELSNSFLVFADRKNKNPISDNWLVKAFSTARRSTLWNETTITRNERGLSVKKRPIRLLHKDSAVQTSIFYNTPIDSDYIKGQLWVLGLWKLLVTNSTPSEIRCWLLPWLDFLRKHSVEGDANSRNLEFYLPSNFIDCTPFNLIESETGDLHYIDAEWSTTDPIPAYWVIIRGILFSIEGSAIPLAQTGTGAVNFIDSLMDACGLELTPSIWESAIEYEVNFQNFVGSKTTMSNLLKDRYTIGQISQLLIDVNQYHTAIRELAISLGGIENLPTSIYGSKSSNKLLSEFALRAEINRVKGTYSWRVTAPFRGVWNAIARTYRTTGNRRAKKKSTLN